MFYLFFTATVRIPIDAGKSRKISSPNYPCGYPDCTSLAWIVQAAADRKLRVTFTYFYIADTSLESIQIGDGDDINNPSTRFFGWDSPSTPPSVLISDGYTMWITFRSTADVSVKHRFQMEVTSVPSTGMFI